jgi:pSer/pThr/pTyr-binding forkhead associated (FHA) protein
LIIIKGPDEGRQFELPTEGAVSIGRDRASRFVLHDTEVSRKHAEIAIQDDVYRLRDIGSANGTLVNTKPVTDAPLQPGDHITIGQTILVFSSARTERPAGLRHCHDSADHQTDNEVPSAIVDGRGRREAESGRPEQAGTQWLKTRLA